MGSRHSPFAEAAQAELAKLEAELAVDPRLAKVNHLRELVALYGVASPPTTNGVGTMPPSGSIAMSAPV